MDAEWRGALVGRGLRRAVLHLFLPACVGPVCALLLWEARHLKTVDRAIEPLGVQMQVQPLRVLPGQVMKRGSHALAHALQTVECSHCSSTAVESVRCLLPALSQPRSRLTVKIGSSTKDSAWVLMSRPRTSLKMVQLREEMISRSINHCPAQAVFQHSVHAIHEPSSTVLCSAPLPCAYQVESKRAIFDRCSAVLPPGYR